MDDEKARLQRYSTISPNVVDIGSQSPSNEHIDRMGGILLTYNLYERELGSLLEFFLCVWNLRFLLAQDMFKACRIFAPPSMSSCKQKRR